MKTKVFILSVLLLLVSATGFCDNGRMQKTKTVNKSFSVGRNATLDVSNQYGDIVINQWDKKEIVLSVEITGEGTKEDVAQKMLDRVNIEFNQSGGTVYAKTILNNLSFKCNNCGITINYTINVPADAQMKLENKYGDVTLQETSQPFQAVIKYGNLRAKKLLNNSNKVEIKYGEVRVGEAKNMDLRLQYSDSNVEKAEQLTMDCAYSDIYLGTIGTLDLKSKYDDCRIETVNDFSVYGAYTDFTIQTLNKRLNAPSLRYAELRVREVGANLESIDVQSSYTTVRLGVSDRHNCKINLSCSYGDIKTNGLTVSQRQSDKGDFSQKLTGIIGSGNNPTATIRVSTTYDDIILGK